MVTTPGVSQVPLGGKVTRFCTSAREPSAKAGEDERILRRSPYPARAR